MKRLLSVVFAVSLIAGAVSIAQADPRNRDDHRYDQRHHESSRHSDHDRGRWGARNEWRTDRDSRHFERHSHDRDFDRREAWVRPRERFHADAYRWPSSHRHYAWSRGDYVPVVYRSSRYVVRDYGHYGLYAPPRGCQWVRVGNDVLLTAVATGVVVSIVGDLFY